MWARNFESCIKCHKTESPHSGKGLCGSCRAKDHYLQNKERLDHLAKIRDKKNRMLVLIHYGGNPPRCKCCGEESYEFLAIDHIHGGGYKHRKEIGGYFGRNFYKWLIKNNFPDGFQVLCHNCNLAKGFYGDCPHELKLNFVERGRAHVLCTASLHEDQTS